VLVMTDAEQLKALQGKVLLTAKLLRNMAAALVERYERTAVPGYLYFAQQCGYHADDLEKAARNG